MIENIIIILVITLIVYRILHYLYQSKKQGHHCIGCPYGKQCCKSTCASKQMSKPGTLFQITE